MSKLSKKQRERRYQKLFEKIKSEFGMRIQNRFVLEQKRKQK